MRWKAQEVSDMIGVPYRTLMSWVERGLFAPEGFSGRRGSPAMFSKKDIRELFIYKVLRDQFTAQELGMLLTALRGVGHNPFSDGHFIIVANDPSKGPAIQKVKGDEILEFSKKHKTLQYRLFPITAEGAVLETLLQEVPSGKAVVSRVRKHPARA